MVDAVPMIDGILTKRMACSVATKIFDLLGFLEPYLVKAKIMVQELWAAKLKCDENIPQTTQKNWKDWIDDIRIISDYRFPRFCISLSCVNELHFFSDSSEKYSILHQKLQW